MSFSRLIRFTAPSNPSKILLGEPIDESLDVGLALRKGAKDVRVKLFSGTSALNPGDLTDKDETVGRILSPLSQEEVGTIRCIGLNYRQHAKEVNMALPEVITVFLKPSTALANPYPDPTIIPKFTVADNCADWESELAIVLSKPTKNVSEEEALDYVLGYTAANDVSSRKTQLNQSQWCFSKGFDGSCPIGPVLVSPKLIPDASKLRLRGLRNGEVRQDCGLDDMVFGVAKLVSFLSQGTTLPAGTVIVTGTPAGVGLAKKDFLQDGDEFSVEILPHIGTMTTIFETEKEESKPSSVL